MLSAPGWPMFRTRAEQVSGWEAALPAELLRLPEELARVDALLDDPVFFAPFAPFFDPRLGWPSTPVETYPRHHHLLRREMVLTPAGTPLHVPIVSGNGLRGRLRRIGEELLRDVLQYEQQLPLSAAHALRGGGSLAKTTGEPLSGRRLHTLRELIPQVGVFGCAAGGRIIDGCLQVGKVVPHLAAGSRQSRRAHG